MWLDTIRIARDGGGVAQLLPEGIDSLADAPYTLHQAIRIGLAFLSYEELPKDERPPKSIWMNNKRMEEWWADVDRRREERYGGGGDGGSTSTSLDEPPGPGQRNALVDELVA